MKRVYLVLMIAALLLSLGVHAQQQQRLTLSGYIRDASSGEELIGATVQVVELPGTGATTNIYGYYALPLPAGNYTLRYQYLGYQSIERQLNLASDTRLDIELQPDEDQLEEVVITGERKDANVSEVGMSREKLSVEAVKKVPALFGEVDVLRTIQLLPGVQTAGEGTTGLFVRGGAADQNLVLLDEATVYNASHLFGFFSVFNPDAIKNLEIYKGGIPARFGGRLSSILDIQMKEGNNKEYVISGGVGLIASRLTVEGPIWKDRSSFIVSGRRTYADIFLRLSPNENINRNTLYFYDFNMKANLIMNENNRFYVSGYFGRDVLGLEDFFSLDWGNTTLTTRWNHLFNDRLFLNTSLIFSNFSYGFTGESATTQFTWGSTMREYNLKSAFTYYLNEKNTLTFGLSSTFRRFGAPVINFQSESDFEAPAVDDRYAFENAVYVGNEWKASPKFTAEYGLRYSAFNNIGPGSVFLYEEGAERTEETKAGTISFDRFENIQFYHGLEPRMGLRYLLNEQSSVKASYNRMRQYLQVASNATAGLPIERWIPADRYIRPLIADQVALGYFRNFKQNTFETSVEVYYKWMDNLVDYKLGDQANILFTNNIETEALEGKGWAYGAEFLVRKNIGTTTGWIGYTLGRTLRQVPGINGGEVYPARYDRIHDLSVVLSHELNSRLSLSGTFVYSTGTAVSLPVGKANIDGFITPVYDDTRRNAFRMPGYHRLDLAATLKNKPRPGRRWDGSWTFSIYNAYARKNPFAITFEQVYNQDPDFDPDEDRVRSVDAAAVKLYLFSIIPSVTYNFEIKPKRK
ncbi:TonB-dependent receptor [Cesiribacter sp. SM1]|uniref:TonB-dependent receptor n=1 Tax=Cesiribacter sp. SM1 TaxID=2861196 RepID=UPI001CD26E7C|nr:TonB-dependent receptor [Cesiribacter sp. SM1]